MIARRPRRLIAALAVFGAASLAAAPASATFPGRNGRIAYDDYMNGQIFTINPDGSKRRQLTDTPKNRAAANPSWSSDGKRIAFDRFKTNVNDFNLNQGRIWVMRADGSHERQVLKEKNDFRDQQPAFTPDGRQIIFSRCHPEPKDVCAIWTMGANGTHKRALTPFIHNATQIQTDIFPAVSANGRRIAFARLGTGGIASRVFVMGIHGSRARPVTPNKYEAWAPDWSPNGKEITFSSQLVRFGSSVFTTKPDGSSIHRLTPDRFPNNDAGSAYSPRGNRIVFTSDRKHANFCCNDLFSIASGGGNDREIHTGKAAGILDPAWGTAPLIR